MVAFGNIVIANEVFLIAILAPIMFMVWYYTRILKSQAIRVCYEDKTGVRTVYAGLWGLKENKVTMIKSRKEKLDFKKRGDAKLHNFSAIRRELWFLVREGETETAEWEKNDKDKGLSDFDPAYEALGETNSFIGAIGTASIINFKNPVFLVIMLGGLGMGTGIGFVLSQLFA